MNLRGRNITGVDLIPILKERMDRLTVRDAVTECWLWNGEISIHGYGRLSVKCKHVQAHRLAYELAKGKIPKGLFILHSCDVRACVNPDHLRIGTQKQNIKEACIKGRMASGEKNGQAKLTEADVHVIRRDQRTLKEIAIEYGIHLSTVHLIKQRKKWKHLKD